MAETKNLCRVVFVLCALYATPILSMTFQIDPLAMRCLGEEVSKNTLVVGEISSKPSVSNMVIRVFDPAGSLLYNKANVNQGKFAFTGHESGQHQFCVDNVGNTAFTVHFDLKTGVEAKDYYSIAKKENLKPLEIELRKLEDIATMIHNGFLYLREREETMRNTNESTHTRVIFFSLFTIFVLLGLGVWQMYYLKSFFRTKKLI
eukprot:GILK01002051.1.p1 GENE.GILK01002051.1~~GILK01002051.1.p1  ORF type:complete len:217 (-),score=33.85 GILK01002051.1:75-686(-)